MAKEADPCDVLSAMAWQEFEAFSVEVLRRYYRPSGLDLVQTTLQGDGGRDGDASLVLAPEREQPLDILIRLWIEVKQRRGVAVNLSDLGGHILLAFLESVTKVVFVTNSTFSPQAQEAISCFARKQNLQYALIDGEQLIRIAQLVEYWPSEGPKLCAVTTTSLQQDPEITIRWTIAGDPERAVFGQNGPTFRVGSGEPVFLVAELEGGDISSQAHFELTVKSWPKSVSNISPNTLRKGYCGRCDRLRFAWPFWADSEVQAVAGDFEIDLRLPLSFSTALVQKEPSSATFTAIQSIVGQHLVGSRRQILDHLGTEADRWRTSGDCHAICMLSSAGSGKSHLLRLLRRSWLDEGVDELYFEGGIHATDRDLLSRAFELMVPRGEIPLEKFDSQIIRNILMAHEFTIDLADTVTSWIVSGAQLGPAVPSPLIMGRALGRIIAARASHRPIVISFDDLHKTRPSVLAVLAEAAKEIQRSKHAQVLFVIASREASPSLESSTRVLWHQMLDELLVTLDPQLITLPSMTEAEATELLRSVVPRLHSSSCRELLDIVGRTPLAVRETLACLRDAGCLRYDEALKEYLPVGSAPLERVRRLRSLTDVTSLRLMAAREFIAPCVGEFLDAGACLGRAFSYSLARVAISETGLAELETGLGVLERHEILRASRLGPEFVEFDHDLVRRQTLAALPRIRQRRIATSLLDKGAPWTPIKTRALLAYQAGRAQECLDLALIEADTAKIERRFADEAEQLALALAIAEPPMVKTLGLQEEMSVLDDAIALAEPPRSYSAPLTEIRDTVLTLLQRLAEASVHVGSGSSEVVERAANEALLLALRLSDSGPAAHCHALLGRVFFERDHVKEALEEHMQAEQIYSATTRDDSLHDRAMNLVRMAIAERELGRLEESRDHLKLAIEVSSANPEVHVSALTNLGASYFHVDWIETRLFWAHALRLAQEFGFTDREVHLVLDINRLDILEGRRELAEHQLGRIERLSESSRLEYPRLRVLNQRGVMSALGGDFHLAVQFLLDAEEYAIKHRAVRRLWKIRSNLASVYEALGEVGEAYAADVLAEADISRLLHDETLERSTPQRALLPLANILLRQGDHDGYETLIERIPEVFRCRAAQLAKPADEDSAIPFSLARHRLLLGERLRFMLP